MELSNWTDIIFKKLHGWATSFIAMLPNLTIAILILVIAFIISKFVRRFAQKIAMRISHSDAASSLAGMLFQFIILFIAVTTALQVLNLDKAVSSILAGIGIIGLALGFAFQDLTANFIAGIYMAFRRPIEIGERVETNGFIGTVERVELRTTTLRTLAGLNVTLPNKEIFQKPIINYSRSPQRRVELEFSVSNTIDLDFLENNLRQAIERTSQEPITDIRIFYTTIEDPKVKLKISFRTSDQEGRPFNAARHHAIKAINKVLADAGIIKIAFNGVTPEASAPQPKA